MRSALIALLAAAAVALAITAARWPALLLVLPVFILAAPFSGLARVLLGAIAAAAVVAASLIVWSLPWAFALVVAVVAIRPAIAVWRFARSTPATRRHYPAVVCARVRWRWLARNCGLAPMDYKTRHAARGEWAPMDPLSRSLLWLRGPEGAHLQVVARMHYPRARFRPDDYGLIAAVRTVPGVGRKECEQAAPHLANYWRCVRVQVSQPAPGRLLVRGLRSDPLTLPLPMGEAPEGVYGTTSVQHPLRAYLGRDEWGAHRWARLAGLTGITVAGLPGAGKTSLILSLLCQFARLPVVLVFIDSKGGGDYADWTDRAWLSVGDELPAAAGALEDVHALMRQRFGLVHEVTGHRNAWNAGPTPLFPLVVTVIDECHTFFDLDAVKGNKEADAQVRACRALTGQLVKKGRSVLMLTIMVTQKQTADAIPTAIRDNCGLGLSFAVKTRDAAVAALGETIRDYPTYCPTLLQGPDYIGVATVSLRTGHDPFVRIRCPHVTEADARGHAERAASYRLDPTTPAGREVVSLRQAITELQPHLRVLGPQHREAGDGR
jgi:DNA segregation ATPase FtsK/SpoIIIE, S-DNA-T family